MASAIKKNKKTFGTSGCLPECVFWSPKATSSLEQLINFTAYPFVPSKKLLLFQININEQCQMFNVPPYGWYIVSCWFDIEHLKKFINGT